MDKYEYKLRLEEIKTLNRKGRFQEAAQVADTIDWKKVRNISTLGIISDVYKINRRFEDAREMLLLANEKSPQNRRIVYSLCDLTIKMGLVVEAVEFYKEFVQLAPNDTSKYILLYKIYEAQDISLEERIAVLKEYKKREYNEKWAYELAFLYHRVGLATECVEECDQLILWFGEGKYVTKAMELKRLYVPLSPAQQQAYDRMFGRVQVPQEPASEPVETAEPEIEEAEPIPAPVPVQEEKSAEELEIQVKTMDMGQYNTINLQAALAESMKEVLPPEEETEDSVPMWMQSSDAVLPEAGMKQMKPNSVNAPVSAVYEEDDIEYLDDVTRMISDSEKWDAQATGQLEPEETENIVNQEAVQPETVIRTEEPVISAEMVLETTVQETAVRQEIMPADDTAASAVPADASEVNKMADLLAQDYDGQISLALPESRTVEKQITGQMNIQDVLAEWEKRKRENQEKRKEDIRQRLMQQTGSLFAEFDQQTRDGVLEKLERAAQMQERMDAKKAAVFEAYDEVEELEEIEEEVISEESVRPTPANAAARAVMAAEGDMGSVAVNRQAAPAAAEAEQMQEPMDETAILEEQTKEMPAHEIARKLTAYEMESKAQSGKNAVEETAEQPVVGEAEAENGEAEAENGDSETAAEQQTEENAALNQRISEQRLQEHMRSMTEEERELFAPFIPTKGAMRQLVTALDHISLSAYTGNMIITGAPGSNMMKLAKNVIREIRATDQNFSGKMAKISGDILNERKADSLISKIPNGALIVEKAGKLSGEGAENLAKALNQEHTGIIVFLLDNKRAITRLLERSKSLAACFTARFDIAALDSATLVKYGCQYAYTQEFAIDELGRLALHTRIEDMQTNDHAVTIEEVREIVDEAIESAEKKSLRHFMDVLFRKRYDEDDMIILRERDFI